MMRVLVADSDAAFCIALIKAIQEAGHSTVIAQDVPSAIRMIDQQTPDFVVLENVLDGTSAEQVLEHVARVCPSVPVVVIAANATVETATRFMKAGITDFLPKPCPPSSIMALIQRFTFGMTRTMESAMPTIPRDSIPNYNLLRILGDGAYGSVYLAEMRGDSDSPPVAIKIVKRDLLPTSGVDSEVLARFRREARVMSLIDHPNVARIVHAEASPSTPMPYVVMEYISGHTVDYFRNAHLGLATCSRIIEQIAKGLQAIHAIGCVHRDLKPTNIIVSQDGIVKIVDFGVVEIPASELTRTRFTVGTPLYMAPEAFESSRVDGRADIFSLGVIAYELFLGRFAFEGKDVMSVAHNICHRDPVRPRKLDARIPEPVEDMIMDMLAKQAAHRPSLDAIIDLFGTYTAASVDQTIVLTDL